MGKLDATDLSKTKTSAGFIPGLPLIPLQSMGLDLTTPDLGTCWWWRGRQTTPGNSAVPEVPSNTFTSISLAKT